MTNTTPSPMQAVAMLSELPRLEETVRARIEGFAWMAWSIIVAAAFLTFDAVRPQGIAILLVAAGWAAVGLAMTTVVRRAAAVRVQRVGRRAWILMAACFVAIVAVTSVGIALHLPVPTAALVLLTISATLVPLSRTFLPAGTSSWAVAAVAGIGIATALLLMVTKAGDTTAAIAAVCACLCWFAIGAIQSLRG